MDNDPHYRSHVNQFVQPEAVDVGKRLRTLREGAQLSIRALAEMSGLAVNTLSLIEHGKTSPSVATLQQLATALRVPITAFFEPDVPRKKIIFLKASEQQTIPFPHGSMTDLGIGMHDRAFDPLVLTLAPNSGSGSRPVVHTGQEFVYCLEGPIAYTVDSQIYLLEAGDSLFFEASLPHLWHNVGTKTARALLVLCPDETIGRAINRHE